MKLLLLAPFVFLAACQAPSEPTTPVPTATATYNPDPCGDGKVLGKEEECK